ncbi:Lrp/AsnC family transcriptional regulator [Candidatus Woesebacteria bacterium]|nr:Lrp/AsnC family transcriptional regulator [Candidatus Woesebacteria bacterium]
MAKRSHETMLNDELRVLTFLEQSGKDSIDEIAKKCSFSRQKVSKIIKKLEEEKIIWGYTAISDEKEKNLKHFTALVKKSNISLDDAVKKEILTDKIDNHPKGLVSIENIYFTHGICDMIFTFYAPDVITAKRFLNLTFVRFQKFVKEYTLIETLFPIRKQGLKNPKIEKLSDYI